MTVLRLRTEDGFDLAAELAVPDGVPRAGAVLLHPNPRMGGDMHATVPAHLFRELPAHGIAALRFDFRGAGRSGGELGHGTEEAADVRAAVAALVDGMAGASEEPPRAWLVGWSYGADVSLQVIDDAVAGWVTIAPPLRVVPVEAMAAAHDPRPKLMLVPEHDQISTPAAVRAAVAGWVATEAEVLPGTDHFLAGQMSRMSGLVGQRVLRPVAP